MVNCVRLPPLEFADCITDSPYFRENLHAHERELQKTSQQIKRLIKEVKDLLNAAKHLSRAQRNLSASLQNFSFECIGTTQTDDESVITKSLVQFGNLINSIEDERDRMLDTAYEQIIQPLENFRKEHIGGVKDGKKKFEKQTAKFCQSQERFLNLSTKKQDSVFKEADAQLQMEQRFFCQASLEYVFLLQEVQDRKKFEFVETLLRFMLGWLTFYHQGYEVAQDCQPFMTQLKLRIQNTRENFKATHDKTESLMKKMMEMRQMKPKDVLAPNKTYTREGYLYLMEKKTLLGSLGTSSWLKLYCMYQKDTKEFTMIPYNQMTGKFNALEKITVSSCVRRMSDTIDKRFCFDITSEDKPGVVYTLQALSEEDRKLWMDVMDGKEPTYGHPGAISMPKPEERVLDECGLAFVAKCIQVLENRGLEEQGLYRVVGVSSKVTKLLTMALDRRKGGGLDKLNLEDTQEWESKTITSALKTYLRNLHEPLMTFKLHNYFIAAAKHESKSKRINQVHALVHKVSPDNFKVLDTLFKHLTNVAAHSDKNLMTVSNLGVCFGPTLLRPEEETVAAIMDIKFCNVVVEIITENYEKIFKSMPETSFEFTAESRNSPQSQQLQQQQRWNSPNSSPPSAISGQQRDSSSNNKSARTRQNEGIAPPVTHVRVTHTIVRSYNDGPMLSASMHNVAINSGSSSRDRSENYASNLSHSVDRDNYTAVVHPFHQSKSYQLRPLSGRNAAMGVNASVPSFSDNNLHILRNNDSTSYSGSHYGKALLMTQPQPQQQQQPQHQHSPHQHPVYYSPITLSSEHLNESSSSESASSLSSRDLVSNTSNNNYNVDNEDIPQKNKRGSAMSIHYAISYKPYDSIRVRTLYACMGENDGELSFEPNQIITNVRNSLEPGWLTGTLNGKTGLVPENYVEILP